MDSLLSLIAPLDIGAVLAGVSPAVIMGLGLGFAFALVGLLISVPVRVIVKGTH